MSFLSKLGRKKKKDHSGDTPPEGAEKPVSDEEEPAEAEAERQDGVSPPKKKKAKTKKAPEPTRSATPKKSAKPSKTPKKRARKKAAKRADGAGSSKPAKATEPAPHPPSREWGSALGDLKGGRISYRGQLATLSEIECLWKRKPSVRASLTRIRCSGGLVVLRSYPIEKNSEWSVGITKGFFLDIQKLAEELRDPLLEAVAAIAKNPSGQDVRNAEGPDGCFWKPAGGHHLLFHLNPERKRVTLLGFVPGEASDNP